MQRFLTVGAATAAAAVTGMYALYRGQSPPHMVGSAQEAMARGDINMSHVPYVVPTRDQQLERLRSGKVFDMLVIGGGATGVGVALDAATRGLDVALIERDDFSSGTSSRSTKLIHGGVRYLEKAFRQLDYEQYRMVREGLNERANLLKIAPHLTIHLPIMLPIYKWWQVPYYWAGSKLYDITAGSKALESSYFLSASKAIEKFPMLKRDKLVGAMVYYDGQHNDSRMNVALALTAAAQGAVIANHVSVMGLLKVHDQQAGQNVCAGATVRDELTGQTFDVKAKCVVNATGPFTDDVRLMDDKNTKKIVQPSAGVHIILPDYYSPAMMGLIDPATSDGRVIFFLPWENSTIAGTTDNPCEVTALPKPSKEDIDWILSEVRNYLSTDVQVRRGDVLAAWSGIRPLVSDPNKKNTESLARNHIVHVSDSRLVTVSGGKWTTYRKMAMDAVDEAIKACKLEPKNKTLTGSTLVIGAHLYTPTLYLTLIQKYGLEPLVAKHLANTYGDKAHEVAILAGPTNKRWPLMGNRIVEGYPYIDAEIVYAVRHEYACTIVDMIARRFRLAFLNVHAAADALPKVADIMARELKWSDERKKNEIAKTREFLSTMGLEHLEHPAEFPPQELIKLRDEFAKLDHNHDGMISKQELRHYIDSRKMGESKAHKRQLEEFLKSVDETQNGAVYFSNFLDLMSRLRAETEPSSLTTQFLKRISTLRSGGGV